MSKLLEVQSLFKSYTSGTQRLEVLAGLSLELETGDMAAVTGVSGSGKSTLLHLIGGMDRPDAGSIRIDGQEITRLDTEQLSHFRNRTIGFVFQFHHLLPEFTALENVTMPLLLRRTGNVDAAAEGKAMLRRVGLEGRAHHRPGELSGGEQQRVALARALVGRPKLLLADEPTGNLDTHTGEEVAGLFRELHRLQGLTSIIVTHNEKLARTCIRSYHLENGNLT
jgi:lipoprotein-releasing system ATP-binding protein